MSNRMGFGSLVFLACMQISFAVTFRAAKTISVGSNPWGVVSADLNRDGKPDLIVANTGGTTVSVLLNNGKGSFLQAVNYEVGKPLNQVTVGDFNEDGNMDIAVATYFVGILLGNGDGTFQPVVKYDARGPNQIGGGNNVYPTVTGLGAADFIGDGHVDLVAVLSPGHSINILRGDGTDGKPDFAYAPAGSGLVGVYLNTGNANFNASQYGIGPGGGVLGVADFNHDGVLDLATSLQPSGVAILLGNGDGSFQSQVSFATTSPWAICTGDINGDGNIDLALGSQDGMSVLFGNGVGGFSSSMNYAAGSFPWGCSVMDVNGDGRPDVVVSDYYNNNIALYVAQSDRSFPSALRYGLTASFSSIVNPASVVLGDVNNDGKLDAIFGVSDKQNAFGVDLSILLGRGDGTFSATRTVSTGARLSGHVIVAAADFNRDGKLDLAVTGQGTDAYILLGNGDGTFQPAKSFNVSSQWNNNILVGDFNRDGIPDLAFPTYDSVYIALGKGDGTFGSPAWYSGGTALVQSGWVADLNRDGKLDLVFVNGGGLTIMLGNGDGTFRTSHISISLNYVLLTLAVADLNSDGKPDIVVPLKDGLYLFAGNGDGSFQSPVQISTATANFMTAADVSGDGRPDLILTSPNGVTVLTGKGDGTVNPRKTYPAGHNPVWVAVGNLNGDNAPDLVVAPLNAGAGIAILNASGTTVSLASSPNPSSSGQAVTFTATVKATLKFSSVPSGKVTFKSGSTTLGTAYLSSGKASLQLSNLTSGTHSVKAYYAGNGNFNPNSSGQILQLVQ